MSFLDKDGLSYYYDQLSAYVDGTRHAPYIVTFTVSANATLSKNIATIYKHYSNGAPVILHGSGVTLMVTSMAYSGSAYALYASGITGSAGQESYISATNLSGTATTVALNTRIPSEYRYLSGRIMTPKGNLFNYYGESSSSSDRWSIDLEFKVTSLSSTVTLVENTYSSSNTYYKVQITTGGKLQFVSRYNNGTEVTKTWSTWTVSTGTWYKLSMYGGYNTYVYASIISASSSSHSYSSTSGHATSCISGARNLYIGNTNVYLRNTIKICGTQYNATDTRNTIEVDISDHPTGYFSTRYTAASTGDNYTFAGGIIYRTT